MVIRLPLVHNPITLIDDEDYEAVTTAGPWHFTRCGTNYYAQRHLDGGSRTERLHTFLTGWARVDHVNGNGLDNRRVNLRPATGHQNARNARRARSNTSGYKGVTLYRRTGRYRAYITRDGKHHHLGYFDTAEEAACAYDAKATELFGEFARLNFNGGNQ